jgi:hypothetical protein
VDEAIRACRGEEREVLGSVRRRRNRYYLLGANRSADWSETREEVRECRGSEGASGEQIREKLSKGYREAGPSKKRRAAPANEIVPASKPHSPSRQLDDPLAKIEAALASYAKVPESDRWEVDGNLRTLASKVVASGNSGAQKRLFAIIEAHADTGAAGEMAHALVGAKDATPNPKRAAAAPVLVMLGRMIERLDVHRDIWRAATFAIFITDRKHAFDRLATVLAPDAVRDEDRAKRADNVLRATVIAGEEKDPRFGDLVARLVSPRAARIHGYVFQVLAQRGLESGLADTLRCDDIEDETLRRLFAFVSQGTTRQNALAQLKRVSPKLLAVIADLRANDDPNVERRVAIIDEALAADGALISGGAKRPSKAPPRVKLTDCPRFADGGPIVAMPKECVSAWHGAAPPGNDYERACDVSSAVGFLDVEGGKALVLPDPCDAALLPDGKCLLVMQGNEEEIAALPAEVKWRALRQSLDIPSGQLAVFDAVWGAADKELKKSATLELAPDRYDVDELRFRKDRRELWIVRLSPASR